MSRRKTRYTAVPEAVCRFVIAVATIALLQPSRLSAQDTTRVPTPTLLKRIAEAVASVRDGEVTFVVANYDSARIAGVARTRPAAVELAKSLGSAFEVYGPFRGKTDLGPLADIVPDDCVHDGHTSNMEPRLICNGRPMRLSQIQSMLLVLQMRDGSSRTITLPRGTDAIFLSYAAYDKFVFPYYERVIGLEATSAMRQRMLRRSVPR